MKKRPFISIVVVTRNAEKYIDDCINSLLKIDYPKKKYEIVMIDGLSTDKTPDIIKKYRGVKMFINPKKSIAPGRNMGIKVSKGKYLAFTDSDCVVKKNWLKTLAEGILKADRNVVAVGGPNKIFRNDHLFARLVGYIQETFLGSGGSAQSYKINKTKYVESIPNCNILYKKDIITKEKYDNKLNIGEDCDLNYRLQRKGYSFLYLPTAVVWHHRRDSFKAFVKSMFYYGEAIAKISKKHKRIIRWYSLASVFLTISLLLAYPLILFSNYFVYPYLFLLLAYFLVITVATYQVSLKIKKPGSILSLLILPMQHISYALGFLYGLFKRDK